MFWAVLDCRTSWFPRTHRRVDSNHTSSTTPLSTSAFMEASANSVQPHIASMGGKNFVQLSPLTTYSVAAIYAIYGVFFTIILARTLHSYPLFPLDSESLPWLQSWLVTTVFDYYGAALCLCGIILHTEGFKVGILWCAGCLLLGSPFCCLWTIQHVLRHKSLEIGTVSKPACSLYEPVDHDE